jgi:hypothetical protein
MRTRPPDISRPNWLMLILTIPGQQPALRVRTWRKLRALGVGALRDGVYLAPNRTDLHDALRAHVDQVSAAGGTAQLLEVGIGDDSFASLFDRAEEYRRLTAAIKGGMMRRGRRAAPAGAMRKFEQLQREFDAIVRRDFFPGSGRNDARRALDEFKIQLERLRTPDEPHAARGRISRLDKADYQARTWITRKRPWVDRLASAWLIRRFIDPKAKIRWVQAPRQTGDALGFDFDGAAFTHVDEKVTFEVLMESFGLEQDSALARIAAIVHYLDVGGFPVPENAVVEAALRGMQKRARKDDQLLERASEFLDDLYAGYSQPTARSESVKRRERKKS